MKTLLITLFCAVSFYSNAQTKKEFKSLFNKSENRILLKIGKSQFENFYSEAKCIEKHYKIPLKSMPIFTIKEVETAIDNGRFRQSLFGLGDTILPSHDDNGNKTITCNAFETSN